MLPGQLLGERYRLESEAGSGGMGTVWRALDTRIERTVAIKILHSHLASDDQLRMRFAREARAVGALQHPGIVQLYDFTETSIDGEPMAYLVMEYVEGHSLADLLSPRDNLPVAQTMELVAAAAMGLQAAHDQGIIHRDVKPGNILVGADAVKIVDFGISQSHGDIKLTSTGHFMGSLHYVSPEQLQGETLTPISDVYSLGVVAYEALTGTRPFAGDTPASILTGHLHHAPTPLPTDIPAPVAAVVMRALDKDPSKRYPSAAAFAAACREVGADTDATVISAIPVPDPAESATTPPTTMEPAATAGARPRRQFVVVAAIVLAVVLAAGAGAAMWINGGAGAQGN
ncbi:MAG: serine/threonine-protein kinase, partial [Stackebrandtia sp.]